MPTSDVTRTALSLSQTTNGMKDGSLDAMFFCGGLPTPGIADLIASAPGSTRSCPSTSCSSPLNEKFSGSYSQLSMPKSATGTPDDTATLAVSNLLLAAPDMPADWRSS
jgi:TRAP-type uncharacterized transport system substrate-binding protein